MYDRKKGGFEVSVTIEQQKIERWGVFELALKASAAGNPFTEVTFGAIFTYGHRQVDVSGFYDGEGTYKVRFMPDREGNWNFITYGSSKELDGIAGSIECVPSGINNHGPVRIKNRYHFVYEDGTPYFPFGTTCYAWTHQGDETEETTLRSLSKSAFNKIRMCVFPKDYEYNKNEPVYYPFEGSLEKGWDYTRYNPEFFRHLENRIADLGRLGIEADLVLFHPYDHGRWGFDRMEMEANVRYLKYAVARLAAYRNIWWSLANEFDYIRTITMADWDTLFKVLQECDPYQHLRSIHNGSMMYDHGKPWVTHCSIQSHDMHSIPEMHKLYRKPVIFDECGYEGNISHLVCNYSAEEIVKRVWEGTVRGGYVGHGECFLDPEDILWWSKGGVLKGKSPQRIAFLKEIMEKLPEGVSPITGKFSPYAPFDSNYGGKDNHYYLLYLGVNQPAYRKLILPEDRKFTIDIIDTWNMTITRSEGEFCGTCTVELPEKPYLALLILEACPG